MPDRLVPRSGGAEGRGPSVRRQMALLLMLAVAPALLLAVAFAARTYSIQTDRADRVFAQDAVARARPARDLLVAARATLETLAGSGALDDFSASPCDAALAAATRRERAFDLALALDAEGKVRCVSDPLAREMELGLGVDFTGIVRSAGPRLDFVDPGGNGAEAAAAASLPLFDEDGRPRGAVVLFAPLRDLRAAAVGEPTASPLPMPPMRTAVVDSAGMVMLDEPATARGWLPPTAAVRPLLGQRVQLVHAPAASGERWVYAAAPLWSGRAWLLSGVPRDQLYAGALRRAAAPIIAPFLMLLVAGAMAYFAVNRLVVRHVIYLARLTRAYGRGRLGLRPRGLDNAPRELAMLADDLSAMAEHLDDRQRALQSAAESNRFLLREVYHRVKNNLQMIVSLLNLQMSRARSDEEREALERIRSRVMAVASVHGAVYASDQLDRVPLASLIRRVAETQASMTTASGLRPELSFDLDEVQETPERATPLALLTNEAMTNAVKYASAHDGPPRIDVIVRAHPDGGYRLCVRNDVDGEVGPPERTAVGSRLIEGFARQIGAQLSRTTCEGRFHLHLEVPPIPGNPEREPGRPHRL